MNELPYKEHDLVRRTTIDYAPELDQEQGITRDMVGEVTGIDHVTPMFTMNLKRWDTASISGTHLAMRM